LQRIIFFKLLNYVFAKITKTTIKNNFFALKNDFLQKPKNRLQKSIFKPYPRPLHLQKKIEK
jgi:hypothetical protein